MNNINLAGGSFWEEKIPVWENRHWPTFIKIV